MHATAAAQARVGSLIEIGVLRALGLAASGGAANRTEAVTRARELGLIP